MAAADTAKMIVELDWKDGKFTAGISSASKNVNTLSSNLAKSNSTIGAMGGTMGKGLSALGGNIKKLGMIAATSIGAVGIFSVAGAFEQAIAKARDFGETVDKTMSLTGLGASKASALASALAYVGVDGEGAIKMLGMAEKNLGALTTASGKQTGVQKAIAFQKTYGLSILDSNKKVIDANELLLRSADLYTNKNIPASQKAITLSKIYGKSWQNNIEIFEMGRQKIAAAETEMAAAGLTMTPENLKGWEKFRDASRSAAGALSGLELQLGLLVMPDLADGMKAFADYARGHQAEIKQFFSNGLKAAKDLAGFITGTVVPVLSTIAGTATKIWGSIPAPMQQLLAGGFVLNKLTGGAVSTLVGQLGSGLIKGVLGMNAAVVNINAGVVNGGGGLPGGLGGAAGAAGAGAAGAAGLSGAAILGGLLAGAAAASVGLYALAVLLEKTGAQNPFTKPNAPIPTVRQQYKTGAQLAAEALGKGSADRATAGGGNIPPEHGSADRATAGGGAVSVFATIPKNISVTLAAIGSGAGGVYERAIEKGLHPSMASVAGTLAKNVAAAKASAAAAAKTAAAANATRAAVFAGGEKTGLRLLAVTAATRAAAAKTTAAYASYRAGERADLSGVKSAALASAAAIRNVKLPAPKVAITVPVTVNTSVSVRDVLGRVATYGSYGKVRAIGKVGGW